MHPRCTELTRCSPADRREPLTNKHIKALLAMPEGTYLTPRKRLKWAESSHRSLRAIYATLAQTGMRKGEVSTLS